MRDVLEGMHAITAEFRKDRGKVSIEGWSAAAAAVIKIVIQERHVDR